LNKPRDLEKLIAIAKTAQPLLDALELYKANNGSYPKALDKIPSELLVPNPQFGGDWRGFFYIQESEASYSLYYKLGWDPFLSYCHQVNGRNGWFYEPDDGSQEANLRIPDKR